MKYTVVMEPGTETTSWGVEVPDLPGCFSAGDTMAEAMENTKEAICLWVETMLEKGAKIPQRQPMEHWQKDPDFAGWVWAVVDAPVEKLLGPADKVNVTLPRLLLHKIDEHVHKSGGTRSGFLAEAAARALGAA